MSFRNVTWQQTIVLVAALAATFAAYRFLGPDAGAASVLASTVMAFLLGRDPPPPPPPSDGTRPLLKSIPGGLAALFAVCIFSCGPVLGVAEYTDVASHTAKVNACFEGAKDAGVPCPSPECRAKYEACKKDGGL